MIDYLETRLNEEISSFEINFTKNITNSHLYKILHIITYQDEVTMQNANLNCGLISSASEDYDQTCHKFGQLYKSTLEEKGNKNVEIAYGKRGIHVDYLAAPYDIVAYEFVCYPWMKLL